MDRKQPRMSVHWSTMRFNRLASLYFLLQRSKAKCTRPSAHETCRRDLHSIPFLWIQEDHRRVKTGRPNSKSKAHTVYHALFRAYRPTAWSFDVQELSGTSEISVSAQEFVNNQTPTSVEHRYYIYPSTRRFCLFSSSDGLVQQAGSGKSVVKQPRQYFLYRSSRRGIRQVWSPGDLQHRSRSAVYQRQFCSSNNWKRNSAQHGWAWSRLGQRVCRTSMEILEI